MTKADEAILGIFIIIIYFLPTIIAAINGNKNKYTVIIINFFLGWTFIGWLIALGMSFGGGENKGQIIIQNINQGDLLKYENEKLKEEIKNIKSNNKIENFEIEILKDNIKNNNYDYLKNKYGPK